jgi:acyl-CoA reductase-like NAD-dependent aldehyde dehydrogenase
VEAIAIANDMAYGLQAYVLSSNTEHGRIVASQIVAGRVLVNTLASDPRPHSVASSNPALGVKTVPLAWKHIWSRNRFWWDDQGPPVPLSESCETR